MKLKRFCLMIFFGVVAFIVVSMDKVLMQSPEDVDQQMIADCWADSKKDDLSPEQRQTIIGACQAIEKVYQINYRVKLTPGAKDI